MHSTMRLLNFSSIKKLINRNKFKKITINKMQKGNTTTSHDSCLHYRFHFSISFTILHHRNYVLHCRNFKPDDGGNIFPLKTSLFINIYHIAHDINNGFILCVVHAYETETSDATV